MTLRVAEFPQAYQRSQMPRSGAGFGNLTGTIFNSPPQDINSGVKSDFLEAKKAVEKIKKLDIAEKALFTGGILPPIRRMGSLPESIREDNWPRAGLVLGMAAANFPADLTQLGYAARDTKKIFKDGIKNVSKNLPRKEYQRVFKFFRGTFLEGLTKKFKWLEKADKTLFETKCGKSARNIFKINFNPEIDVAEIKGVFSNNLDAYKIQGKSFQKIMGRSLLRISRIGLFTTAALEIPALIKSITKTEGTIFDKAKAFGKQLMKSSGYVGLITAGIAIGGAILFPYGVAAELIGMAIGSAVALMASKSINKQIDNIFINKNSKTELRI